MASGVGGRPVSGALDARPVKLTDGTWAVMVAGTPELGDTVIVTAFSGRRRQATVTEVGETCEWGEMLCRTTRGPALPDATPEQLAERMDRVHTARVLFKRKERAARRRTWTIRLGWAVVVMIGLPSLVGLCSWWGRRGRMASPLSPKCPGTARPGGSRQEGHGGTAARGHGNDGGQDPGGGSAASRFGRLRNPGHKPPFSPVGLGAGVARFSRGSAS